MADTTKLIGVKYQDQIHYALFLYLGAFDSPREIEVLTQCAGMPPARSAGVLLLAPADDLDGEITFNPMPGALSPREPYILSYDLIRDQWSGLASGDVINLDAVRQRGAAGLKQPIADYLIRTDAQ